MPSRFFLALALALLVWAGALNGTARAQSADPAPTQSSPAQAPAQKPAETPETTPATLPASAPQSPATAPPAPAPAVPAPAPDTTSQAPPGGAPTQAAPAQPAAGKAAVLPPANSPALVRFIQLSFPTQGDASVIDAQTYLYYIQTASSRPSAGVWVPYNEKTEAMLVEDFKRLWATNFLDDLSIEVVDDNWPNGVVGKRIIFKMEERQRVKIVDYTGSKKLEQSKIDDKLKEENVQIRLDSFIDPSLIRRVEGIVRGMMSEKGYEFSEVTHTIAELPTGPKLVHLTFDIKEGPKVKIRSIDFMGNTAVSDGELIRQMKGNRPQHWLSFIDGRGTYQEAKFDEDADRIHEHYGDKGYINARVGTPEVKVLEDSSDGKTRYIQLKIPLTEGDRYRVGSFNFEGNKVLKAEYLRTLFKMDEGDYFSMKKVRKGLDTARDAYGTGGYWEFTGYPDLKPRGLADPTKPDAPAGASDAAPKTDGAAPKPDAAAPAADNAAAKTDTATAKVDSASPKTAGPVAKTDAGKPAAIVDVTMRLQEGEQYFVNRITFVGNTTTRDSVVRREMRLLENGVFNTEALKFSIKRINQLGYFKEIEGGPENPKVEKVPGQKNKVDVSVKVEEQNRNQLTFGAGVSQYEGFFGQLSFSTANLMGRGESVTFAVLAGSQVQNYQLSFSEPYLFDRPITAGLNLYDRAIQYYLSYTQKSLGGSVTTGFSVKNFTRLFLTYTLEEDQVTDINPAYLNPDVISRNPFLADALLVGHGGKRTISQVSPSLVQNTIDNPIFPNRGHRYTLGVDFAGIGGDTNFVKPKVELVFWKPTGKKLTFGTRLQADYVHPFGSTNSLNLPIYERLFLGGEYSVRGYDIRTIGPRDVGTPAAPGTFVVLGGNKDLLFNAEYQYTIAGPFRVMAYFDAGQVQDFGIAFRTDAFVMSTGAEVRFFMPVLNVPFRLIYAHNINRDGIYDNNLQPTKGNVFRFAVGSTF